MWVTGKVRDAPWTACSVHKTVSLLGMALFSALVPSSTSTKALGICLQNWDTVFEVELTGLRAATVGTGAPSSCHGNWWLTGVLRLALQELRGSAGRRAKIERRNKAHGLS